MSIFDRTPELTERDLLKAWRAWRKQGGSVIEHSSRAAGQLQTIYQLALEFAKLRGRSVYSRMPTTSVNARPDAEA